MAGALAAVVKMGTEGAIAVQVECYAGYRADESPRTLVLEGKRLAVRRILSRGRELPAGRSGAPRRIFQVLLEDASVRWLEQDESSGEWWLTSRRG